MNSAPPAGPRNLPQNLTPPVRMSGISRRGGPSRGGISKRSGTRPIRVDKDGDLDMDGPTRKVSGPPSMIPKGPRLARGGPTPARGARGSGSGAMRAAPTRTTRSTVTSGLTEIIIVGWQESKGSRDSLLDFIERKSGVKVKRSRVQGDELIISVPFLQAGEVLRFDGCQFASARLTITSANAPKISSEKRDDETLQAASGGPKADKAKTILILEQVLASRYNAANKMLDLSRLGDDPILKENGFFNAMSTTSKMFPALMLVADRKFDTLADKREAVHSVNLANNNLKDVRAVTTLAQTFPELKNLSLEGNLIENWRGLDNWRLKFKKLEQLVLIGNPITTTVGYKEEAMKRYPLLKLLDNVELDRRTTSAVVVARGSNNPGGELIQSPLSVLPGYVMDPTGYGTSFLTEFFTLYDTAREELLAKFYDENSTFSMSANTFAPRVHQPGAVIPQNPWQPYYPASRNLNRVQGNAIFQKLYTGPTRILEAWNSIPKTKHDASDASAWVYDIFEVQNVPDPNNPTNFSGVGGIMIALHGEYADVTAHSKPDAVPLKRSFDRTFIIGPGKAPQPLRVVSDIMAVRAWGGNDAWQPQAPTATDPAQLAIQKQRIEEVKQRTRLNDHFSEAVLREVNWDVAMAISQFEQARANGQVPDHAYV